MNIKQVKVALMMFFVIIGLLTITGCQTKIEVRNHITPVFPDESLIQDHPIPTPTFTPVEYSRLNADKKEDFLIKYIGRLLVTIGLEQADKQGLREWKRKTLERIEKQNQENLKK